MSVLQPAIRSTAQLSPLSSSSSSPSPAFCLWHISHDSLPLQHRRRCPLLFPFPQRQRQPPPLDHATRRHATFLARPKRPYTFTQLVTLSDGSTYAHRTTSPLPVFRSSKDSRNSALWNPSSRRLVGREEDEAGRLRAFRAKFGRGWDARTGDAELAVAADEEVEERRREEQQQQEEEEGDMTVEGGNDENDDNLMDLISGFAAQNNVDDGDDGDVDHWTEEGRGRGREQRGTDQSTSEGAPTKGVEKGPAKGKRK